MAIPAVPKAAVSDKLGKAAPTQYTNIVQNKTAKEALSSQFWSTTRFINNSLQWILEKLIALTLILSGFGDYSLARLTVD
jgi:hypothetical protein